MVTKKQKTKTKLSTKTVVLVGAAILGVAGLSYAVANAKLPKTTQDKIKKQATTKTTKVYKVSNGKNPLFSIGSCDITTELKKYYPAASQTVSNGGNGEGSYSFYLKSIVIQSTKDKKGKITGATARVYYKKKWGEKDVYYDDWIWRVGLLKSNEGVFKGNRYKKKIAGGTYPISTCSSVTVDQGSGGNSNVVTTPSTGSGNVSTIPSTDGSSNVAPITGSGSTCATSSDGKTRTCKYTFSLKPVKGKGGECPSDNTGMIYLTNNKCTSLFNTKTTNHSIVMTGTYSSVEINIKTSFSNYTAKLNPSTGKTTGSYTGTKTEFSRLEVGSLKKVGTNLTFNTIFSVGQKYDTFKETPLELTIVMSK